MLLFLTAGIALIVAGIIVAAWWPRAPATAGEVMVEPPPEATVAELPEPPPKPRPPAPVVVAAPQPPAPVQAAVERPPKSKWRPPPQLGTLEVFVRGGWAEVFVGEKSYGSTPQIITLPVGSYRVKLVNPNLKPPVLLDQRVTVKATEATTINRKIDAPN